MTRQFFLIPNRINEFMDCSVSPPAWISSAEIDHYLAIYIPSTLQQQFQIQKD
jgi:hypothetical protein